jgi:hypothetical protein
MVAALLLVFPAGAAAAGGGQVQSLAAQQCRQERSDSGKRAFQKRYGRKHAMRTCIKRTRPRVAAAVDPAGQQCQAELTQDGVTEFLDDYLDDVGSVHEAMAECVAEAVDELLNPDEYVDDDEIDDE